MRVRNPDTRDVLADEFLRSTGADIREGHGEAYYIPSHDFISMPAFSGIQGRGPFLQHGISRTYALDGSQVRDWIGT